MTHVCGTRWRASTTLAVAALFCSSFVVVAARAFDGEFCGATVARNVILTEDQHCTGTGIIVGAPGTLGGAGSGHFHRHCRCGHEWVETIAVPESSG